MVEFSEIDPAALTADAVTDLGRRKLAPEPPVLTPGAFATPSDFELNPHAIADARTRVQGRPAAVLIPIVARDPPTILLTQRPDTLTLHSGQISLPGGKQEPGDVTLSATALREAHEEIGLKAEQVDALGYLDAYQTGSGYLIAPLVGMVDAAFEPRPDPAEVADVFEVPLAFLMDPRNHQTHSKLFNNNPRRFFAMPYQDRYIWGVTAGILRNLQKRLFG